jgi:prevent-host-death family protein
MSIANNYYTIMINGKNIISITEARKRIFELADEVQKPGVYYTLTENGRAKAVILSIEEFESLVETIEVYWDFPNLEKEIKAVKEDFESGNYKNYITLEELMSEHGYVLADKSKEKYGLAPKNKRKSKKRN